MKSKICIAFIGTLFCVMFLSAWIKPNTDFSDSERRVLEKMPELNMENILSAKFMSGFESYALDQFPLRDKFRTLKALSSGFVFGNLDNNELYVKDGHISKLEYPIDYTMLDKAVGRFEHIKDKYLDENNNIYLSIVPSKHRFLSDGRLSLDYEELVSYVREKLDTMEYIDLFPLLTAEDYYFTDSHWRQERLPKIAEKLGEQMGFELKEEYSTVTANSEFYGVYSGQSALPVKPDVLKYLTGDVLNGCTLKSYDTGKEEAVPVYDMQAASGRDPYEMFMSGSDALQVLENPNASSKRELVIFRDSFASSLTPLLAEAYSKITLVDIRYIHPDMLGGFVDFSAADVLFMYSTTLLNNSGAFK